MTVTVEDVRRHIAGILAVPLARATADTVLTDLGSDSLDLIEMAIELQEDYDIVIGQADIAGVRTVGQLAELVQSKLAGPVVVP